MVSEGGMANFRSPRSKVQGLYHSFAHRGSPVGEHTREFHHAPYTLDFGPWTIDLGLNYDSPHVLRSIARDPHRGRAHSRAPGHDFARAGRGQLRAAAIGAGTDERFFQGIREPQIQTRRRHRTAFGSARRET